MIKALEVAIERLRKLPEDKQAYAASVIEEIVAEDEGVYQLSDEEEALVSEGLAALDAGRVVSDEDMAAFWNRHKS